jgi:hypothetical protein
MSPFFGWDNLYIYPQGDTFSYLVGGVWFVGVSLIVSSVILAQAFVRGCSRLRERRD